MGIWLVLSPQKDAFLKEKLLSKLLHTCSILRMCHDNAFCTVHVVCRAFFLFWFICLFFKNECSHISMDIGGPGGVVSVWSQNSQAVLLFCLLITVYTNANKQSLCTICHFKTLSDKNILMMPTTLIAYCNMQPRLFFFKAPLKKICDH